MVRSLEEIATEALKERGFFPTFPMAVEKQLTHLHAFQETEKKDLRHLHWISIDNQESRDLDQLTYAEKDRLYVAIADVDAFVPQDSPIDQYAAHNTTSIYTPTKVFTMLPTPLSHDLTSLNPETDRRALVVEMQVPPSGAFQLVDIYPALVRNQHKLVYETVASWLEGQTPFPPSEWLQAQLQLQDRIAEQIRMHRIKQGALYFVTLETEPVLVGGLAVGITPKRVNRAHRLIENCMIAANVAATQFLAQEMRPSIRRIVRTPKRWDRIRFLATEWGQQLPREPDAVSLQQFLMLRQRDDPEGFPALSLAIIKLIGRGEYAACLPGESVSGHFDLALKDYAHTTAPNRRYIDLVMQRLIKNRAYSFEKLNQIATWCTQKERDALKVERRMQKSAIAQALSGRIGENFKGMITGAGPKGTWVRIFHPPIEGKLLKAPPHLDVGDRLKVVLVRADMESGHIDFRPSTN